MEKETITIRIYKDFTFDKADLETIREKEQEYELPAKIRANIDLENMLGDEELAKLFNSVVVINNKYE